MNQSMRQKIEQIWQQLSISKNFQKKYYQLKKSQKSILLGFIAFSFILGSIGYHKAYNINCCEAMYRSASQFALQTDWDILKENAKKVVVDTDKNKTAQTDKENIKGSAKKVAPADTNKTTPGKKDKDDVHTNLDGWTYVMILGSAIGAMVSVLLGAILLFMENAVVAFRTWCIKRKVGYELIIGLGHNSRHYLNNILNEKQNSNKDIIIVEKDPDTMLLQPYKEAGLGLMIGDASDETLLQRLNLEKAKQIFISAGSDETNIEIALEILCAVKEPQNHLTIIVSLTPKGLQHYYANNALLDIKNKKNIDLKVFCYADEAARELFERYDIDGDGREIIESQKPFAMMVIGSGELALQVIYHAIIMGTLPYDNHLIIYCVDDNEKNLQKNLDYLYHGIHNIENVTIEFLPEYRVSSVHNSNAFLDKKIKNIIVCDDYQLKNIEVATDLVERVYRHQKGSPNILTAIYDKGKIAHRIHEISDEDVLLKDVYTFACADKVCSIDNILGEKRYTIAKFMAKGYKDIFDQNALIPQDEMHCVDDNWNNSILSDKASNLSQSQHMKVKLKVLGLRIDKKATATLKENRETFDLAMKHMMSNIVFDIYEDTEQLSRLIKLTNQVSSAGFEIIKSDKNKDDDKKDPICEEKGKAYKVLIDKYFPIITDTPLKRLINCEHERWNRHHYLNNWVEAPKKDKGLKLHDCLKPFSRFDDDQKNTVIYDLYSILYIPNYCTQAGWKLEVIPPRQPSIKDKTIIGVTGHRNIDETKILIQEIDEKLKEIDAEGSLYKAKKYEILSPLADGADMLVAERAREVFYDEECIQFIDCNKKVKIKKPKVNLKIILPFDFENYRNGNEFYDGITQKDRFDKLYKPVSQKAKQSCGQVRELEWINCSGNTEMDTKVQFRLVGRTIVKECDLLIALYDGKPSDLIGGTAEIVEYAKKEYAKAENKSKKLIVIDVRRKEGQK